MARRILVPVLPSERFYDAVVTAGDLVAEEGGALAFLLPGVHASQAALEDVDGRPSDREAEEAADVTGDEVDDEAWRNEQVAGLEDARQLLYERGLTDDHIDYVFADFGIAPAEAIAQEAAAGGYDAVVLAKGYFTERPVVGLSDPEEIAQAVQEVDGVDLVVS